MTGGEKRIGSVSESERKPGEVRARRVELSPLGVPNPGTPTSAWPFPRGQNPTASICVTPPLLTRCKTCVEVRYEIPDLVSNICVTNRKQTASFRIASLMLAIAPLWLMLAAANTSAHAQTSDNVSNASATTTPSSPADWTQFHRDNMQRWNPYETVLGVNNVGNLELKWKDPDQPPSYPAGTSYHPRRGEWGGVCRRQQRYLHALNASYRRQLWSYHDRRPGAFPRPQW